MSKTSQRKKKPNSSPMPQAREQKCGCPSCEARDALETFYIADGQRSPMIRSALSLMGNDAQVAPVLAAHLIAADKALRMMADSKVMQERAREMRERREPEPEPGEVH